MSCTVCVLSVYCTAGCLQQVLRFFRKGKGKGGSGWGSGATGRLAVGQLETVDGKQEGETVTETATEGEQVLCFCVS